MNTQKMNDLLTDLMEVRSEISRVNDAAGKTVFNPAATDALNATIRTLKETVRDREIFMAQGVHTYG